MSLVLQCDTAWTDSYFCLVFCYESRLVQKVFLKASECFLTVLRTSNNSSQGQESHAIKRPTLLLFGNMSAAYFRKQDIL